jgi:hypothetical protein
MFQPKYGSVSLEKLSECGLKTGIKLMSFCECGKRSMITTSSGLWLKLSGTQVTVVKGEIGMNNHTNGEVKKKQWETVLDYFADNPFASVKKASEELGIKYQTIRTTRSQRGIARASKSQWEQKYTALLDDCEKLRKENLELKKVLFCIKKITEVELSEVEGKND